MKHSTIVALFCGLFSIALVAQNTTDRAKKILSDASRTAMLGDSVGRLSSVEFSAKHRATKKMAATGHYILQYSTSRTIWFADSNKFRLEKLYKYQNGGQNRHNYVFRKGVLESKHEYKQNGTAQFIEMKVKPGGDPKLAAQHDIGNLKYEVFGLYFPIFYQFDDKMKFKFVGVARSGYDKANVLESKFDERILIRLFFDQKKYHLLLMIAKFREPITNESKEQKFFFSEYKNQNGINFAHKVIIQENGEVVEERIIERLNINPEVEPASFIPTT